jgi:hypothetical protein
MLLLRQCKNKNVLRKNGMRKLKELRRRRRKLENLLQLRREYGLLLKKVHT